MSEPLPAAGFVGLGQMGRPMALRLAGTLDLTVCDVDAAAVGALVAAGARAASTPADVARDARVVCVMVRDDDQVRDVLTGPDGVFRGAAEGTVVAVHSTIGVGTARELAAAGEGVGVRVVDAPVSGGALGARDGRLAIMVGGDADAFARARPVLDLLGDLVVHAGPVGAGTRAKLARNLIHFVGFAAAGEAARLAEAAGVDPALLGRIVRHTDAITGGPGALLLRDTAAPVAAGDPWLPILAGVSTLGEKDLRLACELATDVDVDVPFARLAYERLAADIGLPHEENS